MAENSKEEPNGASASSPDTSGPCQEVPPEAFPIPALSSPPLFPPWLKGAWEIVLISGLFTDNVILLMLCAIHQLPPSRITEDIWTLSTYMMLSTLCIVLLFFFLQSQRKAESTYAIIIFHRTHWRTDLAIAGGATVGMFFLEQVVHLIVAYWVPRWIQPNPLLARIVTPVSLGVFIMTAVLAGGIREELQRALILNRSGVWFKTAWVGNVIWSVCFGFMHTHQGPEAVLVTGFIGFFLGSVFIWKGRVGVNMVSHALFNTLTLLLFWFWGRGPHG